MQGLIFHLRKQLAKQETIHPALELFPRIFSSKSSSCRYVFHNVKTFSCILPEPFIFALSQLLLSSSAPALGIANVKAGLSIELRLWWRQEAYKGEIQCLTLPNQICFLTNHNMFHAANLQLLLLSSNQNTVVHRK